MRLLALALILTLPLGGCVPAPAPGTPPEQKGALARLKVTEQTRRTTLDIDTRTGLLPPESRDKLALLIGETPPSGRDAIHFYLRGSLDEKLLKPLSQAIIADGGDGNKIAYALTPQPEGVVKTKVLPRRLPVEVVALTYVAIPPHCPMNDHLDTMDSSNTPTSNFGCSFAVDFAAQLADPGDMIRGEAGGSTDSALTSAAIQRLRDDKLKAFIDTTSTTSSAGGS
jgi:type IV pilus biogenesis protein CpaD/CtpE